MTYKYYQQDIITIIKDQLINITKEDETLRILKKVYSTNLTKYEYFISDLLGVSVPNIDSSSNLYLKFNTIIIKPKECGVLSFCQFECELVMIFIKELLSDQKHDKNNKIESNKSNLNDIRNEVIQTKTTTTPTKKEFTESHIISVVDDEIHTQRLTQLSQYLDLLNVKAAKKKKILQSLLLLWQSAKTVTGHLPDINNKKELIMSSDEILLRGNKNYYYFYY
jgi:hypothetical protein